jgi:hypothetical protein
MLSEHLLTSQLRRAQIWPIQKASSFIPLGYLIPLTPEVLGRRHVAEKEIGRNGRLKVAPQFQELGPDVGRLNQETTGLKI